jgi:hypothetical protein
VKLVALAAAVARSVLWLVTVKGSLAMSVTPSSWFSITVTSPWAAVTASELMASTVSELTAP